MSAQLSPNVTSADLGAILAALPGEMEFEELGALFETILDEYEVPDTDGVRLSVLLAQHRARPNEARDYDSGVVDDEQMARSALALLPKNATGENVINFICMVLAAYSITPKDALIATAEAGRIYGAREEAAQVVADAVRDLFGSDEEPDEQLEAAADRATDVLTKLLMGPAQGRA